MALTNGPDNPAFASVRNKDARSTESKAFLRSMNAAYNFPPVLLKYFSVVADKVMVYGKIFLSEFGLGFNKKIMIIHPLCRSIS